MTRISPIPTSRVGTLLVSQRLSQQVQADQLALFQIQTQVGSGRRLFLPSDDPAAALRGMNLQRLLERREQLQTNLDGSNSFLAAADSSLANVSNVITDVRGAALGVASTIATDAQRQAVVDQVSRALEQLVNAGNTSFQGRHLFSGSRSLLQPFDYKGEFVEYLGNEENLRSHVDIGVLFETNVPGTEVFGGLSTEVQGSEDLQPRLTSNTLLSSINGGAGVSPNGSIVLTANVAGTPQSVNIDVSNAATVGDVARLIEAGAPATAEIVVEIDRSAAAGSGLRISSDSPSVINITVNEASDGITARELGIYTDPSSVQTTIDGTDLDPVVLKTTRIGDLLGSKAQARLVSAGPNNDIVIRAAQNGAALNGITVEFVPGGTAGSEAVALVGSTLTVTVEAGVSTAEQVAAAITADGNFVAEADVRDAIDVSQQGSGAVEVTTFADTTSGGSGTVLDQATGITVSNGDDIQALDISQAQTVEDLLNLLNGAGLSLHAEINQDQNGIDVRSRLSGADLTIGENGGTTATQLGIRTYTDLTELADFNRGVGVVTDSQRSFTIELDDGVGGITTHTVTLAMLNSGGELDITVPTVGDLIAEISAATGGDVVASIATVGNGLVLTDNTGAATMTVRGEVAQRLGFFDESVDPPEIASTSGTLSVEDRHTLEVDSVFNTLIRLRRALEGNDVPEIGRTLQRLDEDLDRVNFARSEIGARQQSLDALRVRLEDEEVQLRATLSDNIDVDLVEAISNLTARQFALQASLRTSASLLQLSVLDFL